jgi:hypothetical protein
VKRTFIMNARLKRGPRIEAEIWRKSLVVPDDRCLFSWQHDLIHLVVLSVRALPACDAVDRDTDMLRNLPA